MLWEWNEPPFKIVQVTLFYSKNPGPCLPHPKDSTVPPELVVVVVAAVVAAAAATEDWGAPVLAAGGGSTTAWLSLSPGIPYNTISKL